MDEGTYLIINVNTINSGSPRAIDVYGGVDTWGANINLWSVYTSDAQIWALTDHGSSGWQIICSLTGKSMDIENGTMQNGTNVRQWEDNNTNAQRWDIVEAGGSSTYGGNSYTNYAVKPHGTNYCLDAERAGTTDQTNILLWTYGGNSWQKWIFVPVSCFTTGGTYAIRSALDTNLCADISHASTGNGAGAIVWPFSGANNEVFESVVNPDTLTVKLYATHSGKVLDVDHGATENGKKILQWVAEDNNPNQEWLPVQVGSIKVNGTTVPTYCLRNQSSQGIIRVMDIYGNSKTPGTNLIVWQLNNQANQRFWFEKTEMTGPGISTPTSARPSLVQTEGQYKNISLSFDCDESYYQARYRTRIYSSKDRESFSESAWKSVRDDSRTNDGWGPAWTYSYTRDQLSSNGTLTLPRSFGFLVDGATSGHAYVEIDIQVRAYRESYGTTHSHAHGPTSSTVIRIAKNPAVTLGQLRVKTVTTNGTEGIAIEAVLGHDCPLVKSHHVSGRLIDSDGKYISEIVTVDSADPSAVSLTFPTSVLRRLPNDGETVGIALGWQTSDGGYRATTLWGTVDYNISQGVVINDSYERHADDDTWTDYLTTNAHANDWCWLAIERGSGIEMFECPTIMSDAGHKTFKVLPPLNTPYRLVLLARDSSSMFALKTITMPLFEAHVHTWSWGERFDETANLHVSEGSRPKQTRGYDADAAVHTTTGRRHPVAWAHKSVSVDLSVEGSTYFNDEMRYSQDEDFERLTYVIGQGQHPVYRTPRGDWYRVVVKGVDNPYQEEWGSEVKVSQEAVTV